AAQRSTGDTKVAAYAADDPSGVGPAIQIVTDQSPMLMDTVTVLLHRLGVAYSVIMNPVFRARRNPAGELLDVHPAADPGAPTDGVDETWIHVQLSPSADAKAVAEAVTLLPNVLGDARQVALDSAALNAALVGLAGTLDSDRAGHFPSYDRRDVAALLRWLADDHFVLLGYQRCSVSDGRATVDPPSRLGVLRLRTDVLPQLTGEDDLLVLAQATSPSYLRYGAHPHIVVVRERPPGGAAIEHRFVGLFTVAASNANVMEIPLISRRVTEALALSHGDNSHPGQLTLDIIQTIPRSELFSLTARQLLDMANAVVDLGSRRRTLLFLRTDQLSHFVSCLVYLPRDRYTTAVRLAMQDLLVRELGGESIEYTARVSESPWAVVHFTVRLPDGVSPADVDTSLETETRIQNLLTEAARTWGDRLMGSVRTGAITPAAAEHYSVAFPEVYRQAFTPHDAIGDIAIIEQLQDNSVKLVFADGGEAQPAN
ncbi:MAG: NAD-glutamate dehydrogenase, partial [Myxococcota bacterium]